MKRRIRKKLIPILLAAVMLMALPLTASANTSWEKRTPVETTHLSIGPQWEAASQIFYDLSISGGTATGSATFFTRRSTDTIYLTITLEKLNGSSTTYVKSWYGSGTGVASASGSQSVSSGSYWLKVTGTVYDQNGKYIETVTVYSSIRSC